MNHPLQGGVTFVPELDEFARQRAGNPMTVLSGSNNSGKSLVLKWLRHTMGKTAYMVGTNRFYHVYHFSSSIVDPSELDNYENQFRQQFWNEQYNYEQNFIDLNRIVTALTDDMRAKLFEVAGRLLGASISMKRVMPNNEYSHGYIDVDGQNLSVSSTGTRLLLTILGICMDTRFKSILLDEPELGLSPRIQRALADYIQSPETRAELFPHIKQIVVATHSHHFLHRKDLSANFVIAKTGSTIQLEQVTSVSDFHRLQFNLLGNSLEGLFLPSAIIVVEGDSDLSFIAKATSLRFEGRNVVVTKSDGDPKRKFYSLRDTLGDIQLSPLRSRIFVVVDSIHNAALKGDLVALGLLPGNFIAWSNNGIEFLYPRSVLAGIFHCSIDQAAELSIKGDDVVINGISRRKRELGVQVASQLSAGTEHMPEFESKLLSAVSEAIG